jgi:hypothetical protein
MTETLPERAKYVALIAFIMAVLLTASGLTFISKNIFTFIYFVAMALPFVLVGFVVLRSIRRSEVSRMLFAIAVISIVFVLGTAVALVVGTILNFFIAGFMRRWFYLLWPGGIILVGCLTLHLIKAGLILHVNGKHNGNDADAP